MVRNADESAYDGMGRRIPGTLADGSEAHLRRIREERAHAAPIVHKAALITRTAPAGGNGRTGTIRSRTIDSTDPVTILDVPFDRRYDARNAGAVYDKTRKISYYKGRDLPHALTSMRSQDYSYARWIEDDLNGRVRMPTPGPVVFAPRPHQTRAAEAISRAWAMGSPGFLLADSTGLGKTLSIVDGVCEIAAARHATPDHRLKVLIVCPLGAIPVWRQTLRAYPPTIALRPMIINYQRLLSLLRDTTAARSERAKSKNAKTRRGRSSARRRATRDVAREGEPIIRFDVIVYDEAHYLKNYGSSQMSLAAASIARLHHPYRRPSSPFVVYSTATPAATPLQLAIMGPTLGPVLHHGHEPVDPTDWGRFLSDEGYHVSRRDARSPWTWISAPWYGAKSTDPAERKRHRLAEDNARRAQNEDTSRIGKALTGARAYLARTPDDLRGWPRQNSVPYLIELDPEGVAAYDAAWTRFRRTVRLGLKGQVDPKDALTEQLRFRQKSSILKAPTVAEHAADLVDAGNQVFIGCEFHETMDLIESTLDKRRVKWVEVSGRRTDRTAARIAFQNGDAPVVVCSVKEAISFHASESLPDGSTATTADRVTIIADVRQNPNDTVQMMGRCHRDGQASLCEFPVIVGTVDEKVVGSFITKVRNMKTMMGADDPDYLTRVFEEVA